MRAVTAFVPVILLAVPAMLSAQKDECVIFHTCPKTLPPRKPTPPPRRPTPVEPVQSRPKNTGDCTAAGDNLYFVFFELDKSDITPEAAEVLDRVVEGYRDKSSERYYGHVCVSIHAYTDRRGLPRENIRRSQHEAASAKAYLISRGIPANVIATAAYGETNLRVATGDGVSEVQNRRAEIRIGYGGTAPLK